LKRVLEPGDACFNIVALSDEFIIAQGPRYDEGSEAATLLFERPKFAFQCPYSFGGAVTLLLGCKV
jgi:hypothetical protein